MQINPLLLDDALDHVLEAALAPERWSSVLERICEATGSFGAHILPLRGKFSPGVPATPSLREAFEVYFREGWHLQDIRFGCVPHVLRKGVAVEHDISSEDDFRRSSYYNDFLGRFGFRYSAMIGFTTGDTLLSLGLQRTIRDAPFDRDEERILVRMRNRLSMAADIMRGVSFERINGMSDAFDMADTACAFYDRHGRVTRLNKLCESLLDQDIRLVGGELTSRWPTEGVALRGHVKAVMQPVAIADTMASSPVRLSRPGRRPLVVRAQRLRGMPAEIFSHSVAVAIVTDIEARPVPAAKTLQILFSLTAQEAVVAIQIARGLAPKEIAETLGVSYETIRTQAKSIMAKTDTKRQSEIVALLSGARLS
ncbi:helix-turn-helix transcriptional regulator [Mesorhizobium sp. PAMC28654]|uniref:helix-turn-helix transcriptional regulator n=1 Tax=Mesorhizobium sp. PAMC28654 TaxID=2880934 RepID=UPI001D0B318D|nr:helix-turn-helix transcriptional regulator [Mesorhizobium sp. PAMC28654]UDL88666.1 helix-turn-helix transcriptional regulator [Mesorhizobium sp. PAMC28654]